ncbi:hypothetical protein DXG01_008162 [Tephrocybe rancida]|nr:hypothetical protein DXG01_008162 [Tephrocybe rancida]
MPMCGDTSSSLFLDTLPSQVANGPRVVTIRDVLKSASDNCQSLQRLTVRDVRNEITPLFVDLLPILSPRLTRLDIGLWNTLYLTDTEIEQFARKPQHPGAPLESGACQWAHHKLPSVAVLELFARHCRGLKSLVVIFDNSTVPMGADFILREFVLFTVLDKLKIGSPLLKPEHVNGIHLLLAQLLTRCFDFSSANGEGVDIWDNFYSTFDLFRQMRFLSDRTDVLPEKFRIIEDDFEHFSDPDL